MEEVLFSEYGVKVNKITPMEGYVSENYQLDSSDKSFVLKVYPYSSTTQEDLLGEIALVDHLSDLSPKEISHTLPNKKGELLPVIDIEGRRVILRLLSFIEGEFLATSKHSLELVYSFGKRLASIDKQLLTFENHAIQSRRLEWNLANFEWITHLSKEISDASKRKIVEHYMVQWRAHVSLQFPHLRHSIIHNDANDWNVLIQKNGFGLIDLGDSCFTATICELAIACSYVLMDKEDPITWAAEMVKGYHSIYPLERIELDVLYYLIAGRLVTSVCKSAEQAKAQPNKDYIQISEKGAWNLLEKWIEINPLHAKNCFYDACGFEIPTIPSAEKQIERRHQLINKGVSISYQNPIQMDSAIFQYMFDKHGNRILDAYNNIPHVGHQHPKVVEAAQRQIAKLNTNTRYLYDALAEYAEQLLSKFPAKLNKVYFVNSGSAASDLAIRIAQNHTQRNSIGVVEHGYHGNTRMGIHISPYKYGGKGGTGKSADIIEAPIPDTFRGQFKDDRAGEKYAKAFTESLEVTESLAAFIAEPIVGCGGQVPLAKGYLKSLYPYLKTKGTLCISDEVQTGFGRMGSHFWGFEMYDVIPDIVVLGKPIANGHPMGAVVTTTEIANSFDNGMEFFSSFGGNPVSCEIGKAVLEVIESEELQANALDVGQYKKELFSQLQKEYHVIGDVRGSGLFMGVELIKDDQLTPNTELASRIKNELRMKNILVSTDGPYESVIKSKPPMCFSRKNAEELAGAFEKIMKDYK